MYEQNLDEKYCWVLGNFYRKTSQRHKINILEKQYKMHLEQQQQILALKKYKSQQGLHRPAQTCKKVSVIHKKSAVFAGDMEICE